MHDDTFLVQYADDIAALIEATTTEVAQVKLRKKKMIRTMVWLDSDGLQLAMQKNEDLLLIWRNFRAEIYIAIGEYNVPTKSCIKYFQMRLDKCNGQNNS